MGTDKEEKTKVDDILQFFRNTKVTAVLIVVGLFLVGFNQVTEALENSLRRLGIIKTFNTSVETNRGQFSAKFVENAWNRMFWMRAYTEWVKIKIPESEQLMAYNKYITASEIWSSQLMNYYLWFDEYYPGSGKRELLQETIQPKLVGIGRAIRRLRFNSSSISDSLIIARVDSIQNLVNDVNNDFYLIVDQKQSAKRLL
ncbi:hypothetical protein [Hymenobacter crusticola]|uniref:Uncharacterized protein n=1 Tax=Hymenobacter crusticola TaxID=1770526 RepID=A0A243W6Q2_9BACT|nr:hypothetical protein [Hymenobacter crusticola]OUJ69950.1 hypothetical protein BXP70_25755 [Hymenobacter crusticola]